MRMLQFNDEAIHELRPLAHELPKVIVVPAVPEVEGFLQRPRIGAATPDNATFAGSATPIANPVSYGSEGSVNSFTTRLLIFPQGR